MFLTTRSELFQVHSFCVRVTVYERLSVIKSNWIVLSKKAQPQQKEVRRFTCTFICEGHTCTTYCRTSKWWDEEDLLARLYGTCMCIQYKDMYLKNEFNCVLLHLPSLTKHPAFATYMYPGVLFIKRDWFKTGDMHSNRKMLPTPKSLGNIFWGHAPMHQACDHNI